AAGWAAVAAEIQRAVVVVPMKVIESVGKVGTSQHPGQDTNVDIMGNVTGPSATTELEFQAEAIKVQNQELDAQIAKRAQLYKQYQEATAELERQRKLLGDHDLGVQVLTVTVHQLGQQWFFVAEAAAKAAEAAAAPAVQPHMPTGRQANYGPYWGPT